MEDWWEQGGGPRETMILWQLQNIVENGLLMRINGGVSSSPTRNRFEKTKSLIAKKYKDLLHMH